MVSSGIPRRSSFSRRDAELSLLIIMAGAGDSISALIALMALMPFLALPR